MEKRYTTYSLHKIKDIGSLEELSKYDREIRKYATLLDSQTSEDLVQDFYLKMWEYFEKNPKKKINGGFIATTLRNRFLDEKRYNKRFDFGIGDKDAVQTYLIDIVEEDEYENDYRLDLLEDIVETYLTEEERMIIELSYDMNLSEISRRTEITYSNLRYTYLKAKAKIEQKLKENRF